MLGASSHATCIEGFFLYIESINISLRREDNFLLTLSHCITGVLIVLVAFIKINCWETFLLWTVNLLSNLVVLKYSLSISFNVLSSGCSLNSVVTLLKSSPNSPSAFHLSLQYPRITRMNSFFNLLF